MDGDKVGTAGRGWGASGGGVNIGDERRWTGGTHISGGSRQSLESICMCNQLPSYHLAHTHTHSHFSLSLSLSVMFTHWFSQQDSHWHWMDGANPTQRGTALPRLQVWDRAPSTHSPHLIFRQIFITINLAWLRDIKIPRIDNLLLENRLRTPTGPSGSVSLCSRPEDQMEKVTLVAHHTWYQTGHPCCCCGAQWGFMHFNRGFVGGCWST